MENPRIIIPCAGPSKRWGNHLGLPKHFAPIRGTPLLQRTITQLHQRNLTDIILIVAPVHHQMFEQLSVPWHVTDWPSILPNTGVGWTKPFWPASGPMIVLFGDVTFSGDAMDKIAAHSNGRIHWFGRSGPSKARSHSYKELFAIYVPYARQGEFDSSINYVRENRDKMGVPGEAAWPMYRWLHGIPINNAVGGIAGDWTEIDDETDDHDTPEQYEDWRVRWDQDS